MEQKYHFSANVWCADSIVKLVFEIPQNCIGKDFDVFLTIDHQSVIQRETITIDITTLSPVDERSSSYKIFLKDINGKFRGKTNGNTLHYSKLLRNKFKFNTAGKWEIRLLQRSELFYLDGIEDISIIFQENNNSIKK